MAKIFNFLDDEGSKDMAKLHDDIYRMCRDMYSPVDNSLTRACISTNVHPKGFEPKAMDKYTSFYFVTGVELAGENSLRLFFNNFDELALYDSLKGAIDEYAEILVAKGYLRYSGEVLPNDYDYDSDDVMNWYNSTDRKFSTTVRIYEIKFNLRLYEEVIRGTKLEQWFDYIIREDDTRFYMCNKFLAKAAHLIPYEDAFYQDPSEPSYQDPSEPDSTVLTKDDWNTILDVARAMYSQGAQSGMQYSDFEVCFGILLEILFALDGSFSTNMVNMIVDGVNPNYGEDSKLKYISRISDTNTVRMEEFDRRTFNVPNEDGSSDIVTFDKNLYDAMKNFRKNKQ